MHDDDMDVEKMKQYLAGAVPPAPVRVEEKKEVTVPEHLKEMLVERKSDMEAQQELDEEIGKSRSKLCFVLFSLFSA